MEEQMIAQVLAQFGLTNFTASALGTGLINRTWKVQCRGSDYVLQRINENVFRSPSIIATNIHEISCYLQTNFPKYTFPTPIGALDGSEMIHLPATGYFRLFPFVAGTHTIDVVTHPDQAFQAASKFAEFTALLTGFDATKLKQTIPDFHNLALRYQQFQHAVTSGNQTRRRDAWELITYLQDHAGLVEQYIRITTDASFKLRVTHHDTKISNVLFNDVGEGVCVIDLDTVMPGYFISDLGDMMRTYLSPVDENEADVGLISVRPQYFKAVVSGYLSQMHRHLTSEEKLHILYAGKFLIYMQALRFLADYLNNDVYYPVAYPRHNYVRTRNQVVLLQQLMRDETVYEKIIKDVLHSLE